MSSALEYMREDMELTLDNVKEYEECKHISVDGTIVEFDSYEFTGEPNIIIYRYIEDYHSVCFAIRTQYCYECVRCFADDSGRISIRADDEHEILGYTSIRMESIYNTNDIWDIEFSDLAKISILVQEYLRYNEIRDAELAKKTLAIFP